MRFTIDNRSRMADKWAIAFVGEHAERIMASPGPRLTLHATYGWNRFSITYRRNRVVPTFIVEDVKP